MPADNSDAFKDLETQLGGLNALIVDRSAHGRESLSSMLFDIGVLQIQSVKLGSEALSAANKQVFDIVLTELHLEDGGTSIDLVETLRNNEWIPRTAIHFVVSAERSFQHILSLAEYAPDDYLLKPVETETLKNRLLRAFFKKRCVLGEILQGLDKHNFPGALAACERAALAHPDFVSDIQRIEGELLIQLSKSKEAEQHYLNIMRDRPAPWARKGLAQALLEQGKLEESARLAKAVIQENPHFLSAYDLLAEALEQQGKIAEAQTILQQAADSSPLNPERQKIVGEFAARCRDWNAAARAFSKVMERRRGTAQSQVEDFTRLAMAHLELNNIATAEQVASNLEHDFRQDKLAHLAATMIQTLCAVAENKAALVKPLLEQSQAALQAYQRDKKAEPIPVSILCDLAHTLLSGGKTEIGHSLLRDIASAHHDSLRVIQRVKSIFVQHDQADAGQELMSSVNDEIVELNNRGVLAARSGDLQKAVELLTETADRVPNIQFLVNAAKAIFTYINQHGWDDTLAQQGISYLRQAWQKDRHSSKVASARAVYSAVAEKFEKPEIRL